MHKVPVTKFNSWGTIYSWLFGAYRDKLSWICGKIRSVGFNFIITLQVTQYFIFSDQPSMFQCRTLQVDIAWNDAYNLLKSNGEDPYNFPDIELKSIGFANFSHNPSIVHQKTPSPWHSSVSVVETVSATMEIKLLIKAIKQIWEKILWHCQQAINVNLW